MRRPTVPDTWHLTPSPKVVKVLPAEPSLANPALRTQKESQGSPQGSDYADRR